MTVSPWLSFALASAALLLMLRGFHSSPPVASLYGLRLFVLLPIRHKPDY